VLECVCVCARAPIIERSRGSSVVTAHWAWVRDLWCPCECCSDSAPAGDPAEIDTGYGGQVDSESEKMLPLKVTRESFKI